MKFYKTYLKFVPKHYVIISYVSLKGINTV